MSHRFQLRSEGIVEEILEIVDDAGIDHSAVVLELTEMALIDDFELIVNRIDRLRREGIKIAIDDFGTGNATFQYAEKFAADILKIDRTFVMKLEHSKTSAVVNTVLSLAEDMGAKTIAEGIEVARSTPAAPQARLPIRTGLLLHPARTTGSDRSDAQG